MTVAPGGGLQVFDVFLSYHWRDHERVEALAVRLREAGLQVFLDRWYLRPGTNWLSALESTLANCRAVAVCAGSEIGPWQQREAYAAQERQVAAERAHEVFPVIPVLLGADTAPLGFLSQNTWVDLRPGCDEERAIAVLVQAVLGLPPGPEAAAGASEARAALCPYRGLLYFREEDAAMFRGREAATQALLAKLESRNLVAVVGDSGCGKSSVVRAGLAPALRKRRDPAWDIATMVPGDAPLRRLAAALVPLMEPGMDEVRRLGAVGELTALLRDGKTALRDVVERVLELQPGTGRLLLVVDQWEELFTLTKEAAERQTFIDTLLAATAHSPLAVVLTLRGDYFGRAVTSQRELADRLQDAQVNIGPMTPDELRAAVLEPARQAGLEFEPGLAEAIVGQAEGEPGHLPLLEFVLRELWENRQGRLLHHAAYLSMGGLQGAIAQRAEAVHARLAARGAQVEPRLRAAFLRLVRPGEGALDTRQRALLTDFDEDTRVLIDALVQERLLVTASGASNGTATVEVAHEALIAHWDRLRDWVQRDRDFMRWRQRIGDAACEWATHKRSPDLLPRGLQLAEARNWLARRREDLSDQERKYIARGIQRRRGRLTLAWSVGAGLALVVLGLWGSAERERQRADLARDRAESLVSYMVFDLRDRLEPIGRLDLMAGINERVDQYYESLGTGASKETQHRRIAGLHNQADNLLAKGQLDPARKGFEQALAISERLAKADPSNAQWQRDLSVSYNKLGDVEVAAGRLDAARKAFEQALAIRERLAKADPSNAQWQRDLSVSYNRLGSLEVAAGRLDAARKAFEQDLAISERLAKADPSNAEWQRDLSVSNYKLALLAVREGKPALATSHLDASVAIAERLAQHDPGNPTWQKELAALRELMTRLQAAR